MDRLIPPMSLWRVESFVAPSIRRDVSLLRLPPDYIQTHATTVNAMSKPTGRWWRDTKYSPADLHSVKFQVGEVLTVRNTVPGVLDEMDSKYEFVEVVLPRHAYINRTLFNQGLGYLTRIA